MSERAKTIDTLLDERRTFAPSAEFLAKARVTDQSLFEAADADPEGVLGGAGEEVRHLVQAVRHGARVGPPVRQVVRRRRAERLATTASTATSRPAAARRSPTTSRVSRATPARSPTRSCSPAVCRLANALRKLGIKRGDRVGHLHADDPGAADGDAGLRAHRGGPLGGLRRLQRRGRPRPHERRRPRSRSSPPTRAGAAAAWCRSSAASTRRCEGSPTVKNVVVVRRTGNEVPDDRGSRPLVPRPRRERVRHLRARAHGVRGPPLHALHLGHHRQAEGHQAHHRRLPALRDVHARPRVRHPAGHRLLVRRRRRLGDRALATSCTGRSATA